MWELVSFTQGHVRKTCLESLALGPKTPASIARLSKEHLPHVSRALRELTEKGLVECLTPNMPKNRIYGITGKGKEVLEKLKQMG
jgi:DNA-binding PadR family transcriptional regulator